MKRKRGSTLVELVISMGAGSVVMLLGISLLHQGLSMSTATRLRAEASQSLSRLATQFRADVHLATQLRIEEDRSLTMEQQEGTVVYRTIDGTVTRVRTDRSGEREHESFTLSRRGVARFRIEPDPERGTMIIETESDNIDVAVRVDLVVTATRGRWLSNEEVHHD